MSKPVQYLARSTGKRWHCLRPDRVVEAIPDIDMARDLAVLHEALESAGGILWTVCRRWFEAQPMVPPSTYDPVDLHSFATADDLESSVGLKRGGLRQELTAAMGIWTSCRPRVDESRQAAAVEMTRKAEAFTGELPLQAPEDLDTIIESAGFGSVFSKKLIENLSDEQLVAEKQWLVSRIAAWRKALADSQVAMLARSLLVKEVLMRRIEVRLLSTDMQTAGKETVEMVKQLSNEQQAYASLLNQLDELAPWMGAVSGRVTLQGVVADVIRILQEYHVSGDSQLIDGFFTSTEIQILLNGSRHMPDPQYRPDIVMFINQARQNLWNRDWKPYLTSSQFKRLRAAWAAAEREARENLTQEESDAIPDFLDDGPVGEFPPLVPGPTSPALT